MLLDFVGYWLREYRGKAATFARAPVVLQHCRSFLFLLFALQSDPHQLFDFGLSRFALQGFEKIAVCVMVKL